MKRQILVICFLAFGIALSNGQSNISIDRIGLRNAPVTPNPDWAPFYHGVASGDPLSDRVIIWTRVTPEGEGNLDNIDVDWQMATDIDFQNVVQSGKITTNAAIDFTVKVDVDGLDAGTTYYYYFSALGKNSLIGKTKTTPTGDMANHLKFGVVSCSNFPAGYFNAYQRLADRRDLDAIIHLGDYIYEYGNGVYGDSSLTIDRVVAPDKEITSLEDYRTRYSTYRLDTSLIRAHQQHPFILVWDDHESANDAYKDGAQNHNEMEEGTWEVRKTVAKQAYFEWMPIRNNSEKTVYRTIKYGDLMDLIMLDTRLEGREKQILDFFAPELQDTNRTLLGTTQKEWFLDQLQNSDAKWRVIGQQVIFSELNVGFAALLDNSTSFSEFEGLAQDIWDGYPAERNSIISFIEENKIGNVVILTGDFHTSLAFEVTKKPVNLGFQNFPGFGDLPIYSPSETYDPATGEGSIGVEFATPSISSANFDENFDLASARALQAQVNQPIDVFGILKLGNPNPHMKMANLVDHGYFILDVKPDSVQADYFYVPIHTVSEEQTSGSNLYVLNGQGKMNTASAPAAEKSNLDVPAPANPFGIVNSTKNKPVSNVRVLSVFPNPSNGENTLNYAMIENDALEISLLDSKGALVKTVFSGKLDAGVYTFKTNTSSLPKGLYLYQLKTSKSVSTAKLIVE